MNLLAQDDHKTDHRTSLSLRWAATRDDLRTRRAVRTSEKTLLRELASYTTPAEQLELDATLARAKPDAAAEIRSFVQRSRVA